MRLRRTLFCSTAAFFILSLSVLLRAQTSTGVIAGSVLDPQGGVVPGADVVLTHATTGVKLSTITNDAGTFVFPSVLPGRYSVAAQAQGFKRLERTGLNLSASERLAVGSLILEVGINSETVTVSADSTPVQVSSQERSAVLNDKQMTYLSAQGRDFLNLLKVLPGVTYPDGGGTQTLGTSGAPVINGIRNDYTALNLDGVVANNRGLGTTENMLNLDAIAEVKVLLGNYQAEYGKNAGAIVNVVTKNGTRDFHGTGYWYKRHEMFNANDFFNNRSGQPKGRYRYATVGYNVGGPIYLGGRFNKNRDKLFFFWSQEIQPNKRPSTRTYTFPTDLERSGDFSKSLEPNGALIVVRDPTNNNQAFPGNVVPASRINTSTQKLLSVFPLPNFFDRNISKGNYNYIVTDDIDNPAKQIVYRIDYNPTAKWRLYFRGMNMSVKQDGLAVTANSNAWGIRQTYETTNPNYGFNLAYMASPSLVNELSLGLSRWTEVQAISDSELARIQRDKLGIKIGQVNASLNPLNVIPTASFSGVTGAAGIGYDGRFPMDNYVSAFSISDGLTKVSGKHVWKAGIYYEFAEYLQRHHGSNFAGNLNFGRSSSNPFDSNHPYANALLGNFQSYTEVTARVNYQPINKVLEWYVQDNWKVSRGLTLDYGMRFTYDIPPYQKKDVAGNFDPARYSRAKAPSMYAPFKDKNGKRWGQNPLTGELFPEAYIGMFVPNSGDPFIGAVKAGDPAYPRGFVQSNGTLLAPRVGFAYDPFCNGKTAIRVGFGVFYNARPRSGQMGDMSFNPPFQAQPVQYYGNTSTFLTAGSLLAPSSFNRVIDPHAKVLTMYQMTLGVQRNLTQNIVLDIAYSGNLGRHLGQTRQINNVPYGARFLPGNQDATTAKPLPDNFFRPYYGFGGMPYLEFAGSSSYHALQTQIKRNFFRGLQFSAAWTWSKAMNYGEAYDAGVANFNPIRFWNYAPSDSDRTHTLVGNWVWSVPNAGKKLSNPIVHWALDNWQISGICAFVSGSPRGVSLTLSDAADLTGGGDGSTVVMTGRAVLSKSQRSFSQFFNTGVFARPAVGGVGSGAAAQRYAFRGPGVNNWDLTFFKNIPIKEKITFQIRWEMYNAFNHTQFNGVDAGSRFDAKGAQINTQFGQITSSRSPRIQQLAVRLNF